MEKTQNIKINNVVKWIANNPRQALDTMVDTPSVSPFPRINYTWAYKGLLNEVSSQTYIFVEESFHEFVDRYFQKIDKQEVLDSDPKWATMITWQAEHLGNRDTLCEATYFHDKFGYLVSNSLSRFNRVFERALYQDLKDENAAIKYIEDLFTYDLSLPILIANAFMHCKNVEIIDEPVSRQVRRMRERHKEKDRETAIEYKILDLYPLKKQVRYAKNDGGTSMKKALHIVRGHFATYTEDAPLFGKVTGTFWKPAHARGLRGYGEIDKDYRINT